MINRVLLYNSGGGVGDAIQILPLINTLKTNFKNAKFLEQQNIAWIMREDDIHPDKIIKILDYM